LKKSNLLDKFMSQKGLYTSFWITAIVMVTMLIIYTSRLAKEVPPIPQVVKSTDGQIIYTYDDVVQGKVFFQEFDLMDYGSLLGMGAYMGPDFSTEFFHKRAEFLYQSYSQELYQKDISAASSIEKGAIKVKVIQDFKEQTVLSENSVTYSIASKDAFLSNKNYLVDYLVNGNPKRGFRGGVIRTEEAEKIAAFVDWSQIVASSLRPNTDRTWSNNWPPEPLIDQDITWTSHFYTLWEMLVLWTFTILVIYLSYEYLFKKDDELIPSSPLVITHLFPSQKKLLKYIPIVALFFVIQTLIGGYLAHLYSDPTSDFLIAQEILPFHVMRAIHTNMAIIWVAIGWLVGGLFIAPLVANIDLKFPRLVDVLWVALLIVGSGGIIGIYMGAQGYLRESWFWLGNEGRELLNLGRVWDIGLVIGLVMWFLMVISVIRKAKDNNILVGTIIWSSFGIATLYLAGMMPIHKVMPNYTVDDYYRWWVVHLWVELTFELFAAGVIAFLSVALGLVPRKTAERVMLFELLLIAMSGTLGVGHHYWWQGLDEHWIAIGGIFSALEPLPLALLMIEALKEQKTIKNNGSKFEFAVPFMWIAGSAILNWVGAGFLGMVINTPTINYYSHGTYLIMPHGHVALLGAFGYISIAFLYLTARSNALAQNLNWNPLLSKIGFGLVTTGTLLFALPTLIIGFEQTKVAHNLGYYTARLPETLIPVQDWIFFRIVPDGLVIMGAIVVFIDLMNKTYFSKKNN